MSTKSSALSQGSLTQLPMWFNGSGPEAEIIISTRIRVARNLAHHRFPAHASTHERTVVYEKVAAALRKHAKFRLFTTVNFSGISPLEQQLLVERRIASPDLIPIEGDRGVVYDDSQSINIMINEEDHVRLQCLDSGCRPSEAWKIVDVIDESLGRELDFAFNPNKGFLTCCPTNSGTGLRVSFLLHLPGLVLTKAVDAVLQGASQMGIATRGFFGEHSEVIGSFFQLSNQASMGSNEHEFIEATHRTINEVATHEREARHRLIKEARLEVTDKVYRAFGILQHARTLSIPEYLNLTSALRLGIDCGLFSEIAIEDLNRTTLFIMPAHLQKHAKKAMDATDLSIARAERVRALLMRKRPKKASSRLSEKNE
jgi:protein arginine kinase